MGGGVWWDVICGWRGVVGCNMCVEGCGGM